MKLRIGFSPCPNDTFIFDALVNGNIDTGEHRFEAVLADVETLNKWALEDRLDITKLSFPAFFQSADKYVLLDSGSALGNAVGPLLVGKTTPDSIRGESDSHLSVKKKIENASIALPGVHTTANFLFSYAFPEVKNKQFMVFSEIEDAVVSEKSDFGVIIHESRFTYEQKGLRKLIDLGEYWTQQMKLPVPLGGVAVNRKIEKPLALNAEKFIKQSLEFAFKNYPEVTSYVKEHSQTMSEEVMRKHIDLYVNNFSLSLGAEGRQAIHKLHEVYCTQQKDRSVLSSQLFLS